MPGSAGGDDKFVVGHLIQRVACEITALNRPALPVDGHHFGFGAGFYPLGVHEEVRVAHLSVWSAEESVTVVE